LPFRGLGDNFGSDLKRQQKTVKSAGGLRRKKQGGSESELRPGSCCWGMDCLSVKRRAYFCPYRTRREGKRNLAAEGGFDEDRLQKGQYEKPRLGERPISSPGAREKWILRTGSWEAPVSTTYAFAGLGRKRVRSKGTVPEGVNGPGEFEEEHLEGRQRGNKLGGNKKAGTGRRNWRGGKI